MPQTDAPGSGPSAGQAELSPQLVEELVRAAVAAPSMHNTQPWRFEVRPGMRVIELRADPARMLPCADPCGHGMYIGCGAALFNLRLAAAVAGCQPVVEPFPDPDEPLLLATVRLTGPYRADDAERELYAAIPNRHTNRGPFSGQLVPPGVLAELADAAGCEDAILQILDHNETVRMLHLAVDAEREQLADPAYRAELARWVGGQRDRDGIPDSALGPRSPAGPTPVRDFTAAGQEPVRYALFEATPQLAVLSTRLSVPADWLRAGQALERVLLTATARGVAAAPLTQPLEMADAWLGRDPGSGIEQPPIILRLGYGLPVPPTPRRPVREVLDPPPPACGSDSVAGTSSARAYTSWWQFRSDAWSRLDEASGGLANAILRGQLADGMVEAVSGLLDALAPIEQYWAFPGQEAYRRARDLFASASYDRFARMAARINRALVTESYRTGSGWPVVNGNPEKAELEDAVAGQAVPVRPYFEVLVVETLTAAQEHALREDVRSWRRPDDEFVYELVVVSSGEEAIVAARLNANLQACVIRRRFAPAAARDLSGLTYFVDSHAAEDLAECTPDERAQILARRLARLRPELDLYLMTEIAVEDLAGHLSHHFRRVFHAREGLLELHLSILAGVAARYRAPFFEALRHYSHRPTGVFHALPISQGKSIVNSHWITDMIGFYGLDVFLAETSSTGGGLDSLLEPTGPLRQAQQLAAETFGARRTYFVTNGTSTANKIVAQALIAPGDIVLVDRNCHQSHHYGLMLSGAHVVYLDAYPLNEYSMYGAVPLREIKSKLLALRAAGKLDRVKVLMLTNCTFDGIVYDVGRVMEECLAIKPDLVFLWDEAWFAFARFHPVYRPRTAMRAARTLAERLHSAEYRTRYAQYAAQPADDDASLLAQRLLPDPARARVRVYSTQSTHKTLTALRQGSMIHMHDQDFAEKVEASFHEAYMTHTSTSPNYQILASLDLGRRQASLEGFELVRKQLDYAKRLRDAIDRHPLLAKYMHCLSTAELIPAEYRPSGIDQPLGGLDSMSKAWEQDEFVLDLSRISLYIGATGIDGATFKREQLMDKFGIQVNKTSRNTVLFMTNIGTTRSAVAYLIEVLVTIARDLDERAAEMSPAQHSAHARAVLKQTNPSAPLPDFSGFHPAFLDRGDHPTPEGDVRRAFFLSYDDTRCEYLLPDEVEQRMEAGQYVVSATFVTPYPPGFPVLVPGQVFSREILTFMRNLDTPEIHGYIPEIGYRVYTSKAIEMATPDHT